jgi:hypothetical protein
VSIRAKEQRELTISTTVEEEKRGRGEARHTLGGSMPDAARPESNGGVVAVEEGERDRQNRWSSTIGTMHGSK